MKRIHYFCVLFSLLTLQSMSQERYFTRNGKVSFYSDAQTEKIEAHNSQATSVLDVTTGNFEFAVLMKAFEFEKALMMEHFHENYAESDKFPKSVFKGSITNMSSVNLSKDGSYPVQYKGSLTMHGVTKEITGTGTLEVKGGKIITASTFMILLADYNIQIPALVKDKVAKEVKVVVNAAYDKFNK